MKKRLMTAIVIGMITVTAAGCGKQEDVPSDAPQTADQTVTDTADTTETTTEENVSMANPWVETSYEEVMEFHPCIFKAPEGATNEVWRLLEGSESDSVTGTPLVELDFTLDGMDFTARSQYGAAEDADISGMYYDWDVTDEVQFSNWGDGYMTGKMSRAITDEETADLITWYDIEIGIAYSLSTVAPDLEGFYISAVADAMYASENHPGSDIPGNFLEEQSGRSEFEDFEDVICSLKKGQGYAYINIDGYDGDVLAVTDLVFEADHSACFALLYMMDEGKAKYVGEVQGNGSAYPIRLEDGIIYCGDNHTYYTFFASEAYTGIMVKDVISDDVANEGGGFYGTTREYHDFDHDVDFTGGQEEFDKYLEEREKKPVIEFTVFNRAEDLHEMTTDIKGKDTFTQIVDALADGTGYTNETVGDEDVLLVASGTFDAGEEYPEAIDAEVFWYDDGAPAYLGYVTSGGTAYPLMIKDGKLYTAGNHFVKKFVVTDGKLMVMEEAGEFFDTEGNVTYYYDSDDGGDYSDMSQDDAHSAYDSLFDEYMNADIVAFNEVKK